MGKRAIALLAGLACVLFAPVFAHADTLTIGTALAGVSGPGSVTGSANLFDISMSGSYTFTLNLSNDTGTPSSPAMATSFFDVFVELTIDGNVVGSCPSVQPPAGTGPTLPAGNTFI